MEKQLYGKGLYVQLLKSYSEYCKESNIELNKNLELLLIHDINQIKRIFENGSFLNTFKTIVDFFKQNKNEQRNNK